MLVMLVKERMSTALVTLDPDATVAEARALLDRHRIRHLLVLRDGKLAGIITDRDIRSAASASSMETLRVSEVMTKTVITVSPEARIEEAAKLMLSRRIGGLPVVKRGALQGIITETDLLEALVDIIEHATVERISPDYPRRTITVIDSPDH